MPDETPRLPVKIICSKCKGVGMIFGNLRKVEDTYLRDERDCEKCDGAGYTIETIELNYQFLSGLKDALMSLPGGWPTR